MKSIHVGHVMSHPILAEGNQVVKVDLPLVSRDGRAHGDGSSHTQGSTEWREWRGDAAGDGKVPFCIFGQGLSWLLLYHTVLILLWQSLWTKTRSVSLSRSSYVLDNTFLKKHLYWFSRTHQHQKNIKVLKFSAREQWEHSSLWVVGEVLSKVKDFQHLMFLLMSDEKVAHKMQVNREARVLSGNYGEEGGRTFMLSVNLHCKGCHRPPLLCKMIKNRVQVPLRMVQTSPCWTGWCLNKWHHTHLWQADHNK